MLNYFAGSRPDEAYNEWRKNWTPPQTNLRVRKGMVLVEFGPFGTTGTMWIPEKGASYNAKVIFDSTGELQQGAEIATEGEGAEGFRLDGRQVFLVHKNDILMEILE